jgi:HD-like signal output (HDOD) protein
MVEKVYGDKRSFPEVEQEFFGYNCCQVGGALAQCWGFPDEMVETIRYNSMPLEAPEEFQVPAMTVFIADFLCKRNSIGIEEPEGHSPEIYRQCLEALGLKGSAMDLIIKDVKEEIDKLQKQGGLYL